MYTRSPSILIRSRICKIFAPNGSVSSSKSYIVQKRKIWAQVWDTLPHDDNGGLLGAKILCMVVRLLYTEMFIVCLFSFSHFLHHYIGGYLTGQIRGFLGELVSPKWNFRGQFLKDRGTLG
jgi:hypothetical protein